MQKFTLWASIVSSIIGGVAGAIYFVLATAGVVNYRDIAPLLFVAFLIVVWIPVAFELIFKIKIEKHSNICYQAFMILSIIVGSIWGIYDLIAYYDIFIHTLSGVLIAIIAYSLITSSKNIKLGAFWMFVVVFAITMACGGLWEIWEFVTDILMNGNSQRVVGFVERAAVMDTMIDLICDMTGGILGGSICVISYNKKLKAHKGVRDNNNIDTLLK